jgi:hypothetical protein
MKRSLAWLVVASLGIVAAGCGSSSGDGTGGSGGGATGSGTASGPSGNGATTGTGSGTAGTASTGQGTSTGVGGGSNLPWDAGNPSGSCQSGPPAGGTAVDTSSPTHVVGTGTPASCTGAAFGAAASQGGIITFDCGPDPVTIAVTQTVNLPIDQDTVIDGGKKVTLDGGGAVQILRFDSPNFRNNEHRLTLQHLRLVNGKETPTQAIPTAPPPCSQGFNDGEGGALYMRDGNLTVIDCIFENNQAAPLGPDTGGGAMYILGSKHGGIIEHSTFRGNQAANAGAVGGLFCEWNIYDSLFENNTALGHDANNDNAAQCSAINNGQHEVGSGGNGGAIYSDGASVDVTLCGDLIQNNAAGTNAFGGGLFFTSNDFGGNLTIIDTTMTGNTGGHWTQVASGTMNDAGTAVGTNTKSLTIQNSMLQGVP